MHIPVLQKEVIKYLAPKSNQNFIDATVGEGGHSLAILEKNAPRGKVLGIELDPELYQKLKQELARCHLTKRLILVNDSYSNLAKIVKREKFKNVSGILFDLGLSSWHLEESGRGFSFLKDEPLIMRYNWNSAKSSLLHSNILFAKKVLTAEKIVNQWPEQEIEKILREYGEERFAKRISDKIARERKLKPIKTTFQLVEIIKKAIPAWYRDQKIPRRSHFATLGGKHFATRTFQALRIAVNDELNNLEKTLPQALDILKSGGRLVVISFHSLEDRIVKKFYTGQTGVNQLKVLTKKPVRPTEEEIKINPRSRSAKLRAVIKL